MLRSAGTAILLAALLTACSHSQSTSLEELKSDAAELTSMLLTACSHSQSTSLEELKSDAAELTSIAAEGELFASFVAQGRATAAFVKGHPEYLRKQLKDLRKDLDKKNPDPSLENSITTLQKLSRQLDGTLAELPATPHDPRWPDLATDFARIARTAENLRQTL